MRHLPCLSPKNHLYFDDIRVGQEWKSPGRTLTQADIVNFAGLSGDFNPIHMDHEFAKTTPFRRPIAHGVLVWALSSGLGVYSPPVRTLAFLSIRDWQFREPVYPGDTVRVASKVEPEWLLELFPEQISDEDLLEWNPSTERVERVLQGPVKLVKAKMAGR